MRNAYWDYVFAVQSVDVARRSVELAEQLVKDNQTRVEIGTMAPIDVVQAQSQAATQRQILATARGHAAHRRADAQAPDRRRHAGSQLERYDLIRPTGPISCPNRSTSAAAVRRALEPRTDLAQAQEEPAVNDVTLRYLRNQTLPQADFVARYGLVGQGGTSVHHAGLGHQPRGDRHVFRAATATR